ncbi:MAG TPA: LecA/PA-IL family lectin, partial [Pyrinomonadaceae bacterium]
SRTSPPSAPPQIVKTDNTIQNKTAGAIENAPVQNSNAAQHSTTTANKAKPIELNVKVLADNTSNGWTNSGFVVRKGQKIRIAGDGRISLGDGRFTTPSGVASLPDNDKLMKAVATGALIAVIGDDNNEFIYVGAEREFTASRDGSLFLGVNEGNLNDNSGAFDVKIEIDPSFGN